MNKQNDPFQEKLAMNIVTGSMYSTNFLRNISVAIFDPNLASMKVGVVYDEWLRKCGFPKGVIPYNIGSVIGYIYCGILLAKEKWFDLLPEDCLDKASPDWGFASATYFCPKNPSPTIKYAIRRMRNALGHGNILFYLPSDISAVRLKFFDHTLTY